jgi:hypothetical protein
METAERSEYRSRMRTQPHPQKQVNVVTPINPRVTFGSYPQKGINSLMVGGLQLIQPHLYATTGLTSPDSAQKRCMGPRPDLFTDKSVVIRAKVVSVRFKCPKE